MTQVTDVAVTESGTVLQGNLPKKIFMLSVNPFPFNLTVVPPANEPVLGSMSVTLKI